MKSNRYNESLFHASPFTLILFSAVLVFSNQLHAQQKDTLWHNLPDFNRFEVYSRHYQKKNIKLLRDTLQSGYYPNEYYVAIDKVVIPEGERVEFKRGTTILFEPATSLHVNGTLHAAGTFEYPITFQLINKDEMLMQPRSNDTLWEGITVGPKGKVVFDNVTLKNAQKTIYSEAACDSLSVAHIRFLNNIVNAVQFPDRKIDIPVDIDYDLVCIDSSALKPPVLKRSRVPLITGFSLTAVLLGVSAYEFYKARDYDNMVPDSKNYKNANDYHNKATRKYRNGSILSGCALAVCGTGIILNFTIPPIKGN